MPDDPALRGEPETSGGGDGREPVVAGEEPVVAGDEPVVAGGGEHMECEGNLLDTSGVGAANKGCDEPVVAGEEPISGAGAANVEAQAPSSSRGDGLAEDKPDGVRDEHQEFECSGKAVGFIFVPIEKYKNRQGLTPQESRELQSWRKIKLDMENRIVKHEAEAKVLQNNLAAHLEDHPLSRGRRGDLFADSGRKRKWQVIDGVPVEPFNPFRRGLDEEGNFQLMKPHVLSRAEGTKSIAHLLKSIEDDVGTPLPPLQKRRMEDFAKQEMGNMDKIPYLS